MAVVVEEQGSGGESDPRQLRHASDATSGVELSASNDPRAAFGPSDAIVAVVAVGRVRRGWTQQIGRRGAGAPCDGDEMSTHRGRITRRPATEADACWARAVHHGAVREVVERQFGAWDEAQQDRFFESDWSGGHFEVVEYDGEPCGYVCLESRPADVHVRELDIDPAYQRRGIGTAVLREAIELARSRGVPVVLGTLHENLAGTPFRRLGFVETGRTDTYTLFRLDP